MIEVIVLVCASISAALILIDLYLTLKCHPSIVTICSILFGLFFILPVFLDYAFGQPSYFRYPGFYIAARDNSVKMTYAISIIVSTSLFLCSRRFSLIKLPNKNDFKRHLETLAERDRPWSGVVVFICLFPLFLVLFAPELDFYATYAMQYRGHRTAPIEVKVFHTYLQLICHVSILASGFLLVCSRRFMSSFLMLLPVWISLAWIIGKRHAVAEIAIILLMSIVLRGRLKIYQLIMVTACLLIGVLSYSAWYQSFARGLSLAESGSDVVYDDLRVDFFRDDVLRLALFNASDQKPYTALDYKGESLWIYMTLPIPRSLWLKKPTSYGTAMMCSALGRPRSYLGYGMTTSIFDEAVSNFGFFGLIVAPCILIWIAHCGARTDTLIALLMTVMVLLLFFVQHLSAWMPIFLIWLFVTQMRARPKVQATPA